MSFFSLGTWKASQRMEENNRKKLLKCKICSKFFVPLSTTSDKQKIQSQHYLLQRQPSCRCTDAFNRATTYTTTFIQNVNRRRRSRCIPLITTSTAYDPVASIVVMLSPDPIKIIIIIVICWTWFSQFTFFDSICFQRSVFYPLISQCQELSQENTHYVSSAAGLYSTLLYSSSLICYFQNTSVVEGRRRSLSLQIHSTCYGL